MPAPASAGRLLAFALALFTTLVMHAPAWPGDKPFITLERAAAEEDDDATWAIAIQHWRERERGQSQVSAEYAFDPLHSMQVQLGRSREAGATTLTAELEFKALFNHIARDDWGIGIVASLQGQRADGRAWRGGGWSLTLPLSWQAAPALLLHASAGLAREVGAPTERVVAMGGEFELARRWLLFAEAAREGEARLVHGGVRWWVKRERFAVDLSASRRSQEDSVRAKGVLLSLSWYDIR